jgi:hypothetical protein
MMRMFAQVLGGDFREVPGEDGEGEGEGGGGGEGGYSGGGGGDFFEGEL